MTPVRRHVMKPMTIAGLPPLLLPVFGGEIVFIFAVTLAISFDYLAIFAGVLLCIAAYFSNIAIAIRHQDLDTALAEWVNRRSGGRLAGKAFPRRVDTGWFSKREIYGP